MKLNELQVTGLKDLEKKLIREIPVKARSNVMARALKISAKPMIATAKSKAMNGDSSGALSMAIAPWTETKSKTRKAGLFVRVHVGPRRSNKKALARYFGFYGIAPTPKQFKRGIYHGHFVEFGSKGRSPKPFLRPALAAHGPQLIKSFGAIMAQEIERQAKKGVKQK